MTPELTRLVRRARAQGVTVLTTRSAEPPAQPGNEAFVWLCERPISADTARRAALAGAYDAIHTGDAQAPARLAARIEELSQPLPPLPDAPELLTRSPSMQALLARAQRAAHTVMPVLLLGETGTGKEVLARLLHQLGPRRDRRFVAINCAAIPDHLMESELFGFARGAFSGAVRDYDGQLQAAQGGTVFLDEIDDTPLPLQAKLLRVLEDRVVSRLGENVWRPVDFRLVAATNRDLRALIAAGHFGQDLYERLSILMLQLPPLRERRQDVGMLVQHFFERFRRDDPSAAERPAVDRIDPAALAVLESHAWPGNVRELRNVIYQALVEKRAGTTLLLSDLPKRVLAGETAHAGGAAAVTSREAIAAALRAGRFKLRDAVRELERTALELALEQSGGNANRAARMLGEVGRGRSRDPGGTVRAMRRRLGV